MTEVIVVIIKNAKDFGHGSFRNLDRALHHNNRTLGSKGRLARKILIKTFLQCVDNALAEVRTAFQRRNGEAQFFDCVDVSNYYKRNKIFEFNSSEEKSRFWSCKIFSDVGLNFLEKQSI